MAERNKVNPFLKKTMGGWCGAADAESRLDDIKHFDQEQLRAALNVKGLQGTVKYAIERRLRQLEATK